MGSEVRILFRKLAGLSVADLRPKSYDNGIHLRLNNDQMNQYRGCTAEQTYSIRDQSLDFELLFAAWSTKCSQHISRLRVA